ncbi:MAG: hypothetical protein AAGI15_05890 [Pseudomonadota bacterium]
MKIWVAGVLLWSAAATAYGHDIVRWTDQDGKTHFGHSYLAPDSAQPVTLGITNSMDVPEVGRSFRSRRNSGPTYRLIPRGEWKNKDGWRGFAGRSGRGRRGFRR